VKDLTWACRLHLRGDWIDCQGINWGSVPEWLAAIGTILAFILAFAILRRELRAIRVHEARLVSIWSSYTGAEGEATKSHAFEIFVRNGGTEPVYSVRVRLRGVEMLSYDVLPPAETEKGTLSLEMRERPPLSIQFLDVQGQLWERNPQGRLRPMRQADRGILTRRQRRRVERFTKNEER
jgi:hypothetical protein